MSSSKKEEKEQQEEGGTGGAPPPAYGLHRTDEGDTAADAVLQAQVAYNQQNNNYSNNNYNYAASEEEASSEGYLDIHTATGGGGNDNGTVGTAGHIHNLSVGDSANGEPPDATEAVAEMHLALLYLLSHPQEFERAVERSASNMMNNHATTLQQWNAEYYNDDQSLYTEAESITYLGAQQQQQQHNHAQQLSPTSKDSSKQQQQTHASKNSSSSSSSPPLPFAIFCDDAEVVLPQAHTASQLFGLETVTGMELEAAAGVGNVSRLFLRWLALMPGGDHLNLIDPPGLTVMRIAGGRYRVTAAHRVVWTWHNEFEVVSERNVHINSLRPGDLVSLTVVDVFETDARGKLLSYCPTFDNRCVLKQDRTAHALRKRSLQVQSALRTATNSALAVAIRRHAASWGSKLVRAVDDAVHHGGRHEEDDDDDADLQYHNNNSNDTVTIPAAPPRTRQQSVPSAAATSTAYHADDDLERHEV